MKTSYTATISECIDSNQDIAAEAKRQILIFFMSCTVYLENAIYLRPNSKRNGFAHNQNQNVLKAIF